MSKYINALNQLSKAPKTWLITGVAGFIGSNLLEKLLKQDQWVIGLDNLTTGMASNLEVVQKCVSEKQWKRFSFIHGDVCNIEDCRAACKNVDYVLHQAALGSVPRSISDPLTTHDSNITGHLNMLVASREAGVESFTYAASSSTYGDHPQLPKIEDVIGEPLSPYAVTKLVNELYAKTFARNYAFKTIGLRYFNVFGKRQTPDSVYAAVIPTWIKNMITNQSVFINGDGETSRDFCFVDNVIQANILAATASEEAKNQVYNIAVGQRTSLNDLFQTLNQALNKFGICYEKQAIYRDFRDGDVLHSLADISKANRQLGYHPEFDLQNGIQLAMPWYVECLKSN